jgi:hypothetical protein
MFTYKILSSISESEDFTSFSFSNLALNDNSAILHLLILKQGKFVRNYKILKRSDALS